jgi:hypothetical protein
MTNNNTCHHPNYAFIWQFVHKKFLGLLRHRILPSTLNCGTMSSSAFSFELLSSMSPSGSSPTLTTSTPAVVTTTADAGESPPVLLSGASSGGLSSIKKYALWVPSPATAFCLGCIGSNKFCIKPIHGDKGCTVLAHSKKFTTMSATGYLQDNESRAWCSPSYDLSLLNPSQLLRIQGVQMLSSDWDSLFDAVQNNRTPKWLSFLEDSSPPSSTRPTDDDATTAPLLSPVAQATSGGLLALVPALSFDSSVGSHSDDDHIVDDILSSNVGQYILQFRHNFSSLKSKWNRAFTEVEAGYGILVHDIQSIQQVTQSLRSFIGDPLPINGINASSVWAGVASLHETISLLGTSIQEQTSHIASLGSKQEVLSHLLSSLELSQDESSTSVMTKVHTLESDLRALEQRFLKLLPILSQLRRGVTWVFCLTQRLEPLAGLLKTMKPYHLELLRWNNPLGH